MAFPTVVSDSAGCAPSPRRYSSEIGGGGYRSGNATIGELVVTGLLNASEPLPGWTVMEGRQFMWRVVTESGPQPWPGFEFRAVWGDILADQQA